MASGSKPPPLRCADYHVAWICPVADIELLPARLMLDEEHPAPPYDTHYDENTYICGTINGHTIVVATLPQGETGNVNAGRLTGFMFKTFPNIRMAVLVGIGGGIPRAVTPKDSLADIHLGDVVVGWPGDGKPACVYHDYGRAKVGEFEMVGTMQNPDWRLRSALSMLISDHKMGRTKFHDQLARLQGYTEFAHPGLEHDQLFKADYCHTGGSGSNCTTCDPNETIERSLRTEEDKGKFIFHQGRIATGNAVIKDGEQRDRIGARCHGALCVEMEAAGIDVNRQCLVIRGISDYADSHKSDMWQLHAAGRAAAFARELICKVPSSSNLPASNVIPIVPSHTEMVGNRDRLTSEMSTTQRRGNEDNSIKKVTKTGKQWSGEEDEKLLDVVKMMGAPRWKLVAQNFHRDEWACQQRYKKLMQRRGYP
jgi:nucleoside phosphorylase